MTNRTQGKLSPLWFKEDRQLPKEQQAEAKRESEKALRNSTFLNRRLTQILEDKIKETYLKEEDFENPAYERLIVASASRRKTLREIIDLLP